MKSNELSRRWMSYLVLAWVPAAALLLAAAGPVGVRPARADTPGPAEPIPLAATRLDSVPVGLPPCIGLESGVSDPVFGLLISLVDSGIYGTLSGDRLEEELRRSPKRSQLPYKALRELKREPAIPGRTAEVRVVFNGPLSLPVPYSILSYHPGSFTASEICRFREWMLGQVRLSYSEEVKGRQVVKTVELQDVHLFTIAEGTVKIDIDKWVDTVLGGALDDTNVTCLMLCRHDGEWLGFAMGYNDEGGGRSGVLSFANDKILFPVPVELKSVGRQMRRRAEQLHSQWVGVSQGVLERPEVRAAVSTAGAPQR